MKTLRLGIELETIGQTRSTVAHAIQQIVGGTVTHAGGTYDAWEVNDNRNRTWKVVTDSSLSADRQHQAEIVSPILRYEDIAELQEVVRSVRRANGKVDASCGVHMPHRCSPL